MRRKESGIVLGIATVMLIALMLTSLPGTNRGYSDGFSGGSTSGCTCHGASADPALTLTVTGIPATYSGAQTYTLAVTISGDPPGTEGGFDLTTDKGTFSNPGASATLDGSQEVIHSDSGARTWTVDWTAPSEGSGKATFSIAAVTADGDGGSSGDKWTLATYTSLDPLASILEKTIMSISFPSVANESDTISLSATITDRSGNPLGDMTIVFYRNSSFGKVFLGRNVTDSDGRASILHNISYAPVNGILQVEAVFNGTSTHEGVRLSKIIVVDLEDLPPEPFDFSVLGTFLIVVVGGVWLVFLYVLVQIYHIRREGKVR